MEDKGQGAQEGIHSLQTTMVSDTCRRGRERGRDRKHLFPKEVLLSPQLSHQSVHKSFSSASDFLVAQTVKITADGDCNHEIKRRLLLGRKAMTNLDRVLKSRDITLPIKVHIVQAMVFQWSCMDVRIGQ